VAVGDAEVGRVISRPFEGNPGLFERISDQRKDFSSIPPTPNLLSVLQDNQIKTYSIGKVIDLFAGNHFTQYRKTKSNAEGLSQLLSLLSANIGQSFIFTNLIDTDQLYGHRQDPEGYGTCLEEIDRALPAILGKLTDDDVLVITGDHGNDPADDSTDHTREFVPLLVYRKSSAAENLGTRETFSDVAASALSNFSIKKRLIGESFIY
jgi:phosphopentomutase